MGPSALTTIATLAALVVSVSANPFPNLQGRAFPANAPHGYTPQSGKCPSNVPQIRAASSLSSEETAWLKKRHKAIAEPMRDLLNRINISGLDATSYINGLKSTELPNIGIAISGGGYRAMLTGAGVVEALDSRTPNATSQGQLGGLLQSATYLAGLSGGSWLVGSLYANNFTSVNNVLASDVPGDDSGSLWQFGNSIFEGPKSSIQFLSSAKYYATLLAGVLGKKMAGFDISITDYWGRALSYQLVNATNGGPSYTFSSIAKQDWLQDGSVPLPLIVSDARSPGKVLVTANASIFTFSPWEIGSEDPTLYGFAPLQYAGTKFMGGSPSSGKCVTGFDNMGFVMGTSSSLFNAILAGANGTSSDTSSTSLFSSALSKAIAKISKAIGQTNDDISSWEPNPFYKYNNGANIFASDSSLDLVDGGEDGQNIPFHPLIQPNRHLDVIFAVDGGSETNGSFPTSSSAQNWPAGAAVIATSKRSVLPIANGTDFPDVPDQNTFFNLELNNKPTFFGCDISSSNKSTPLIVYLPNAPYTYYSNISTFDLDYSDSQRNAMVANGYALATQGNSTLDSDWPACVGCAILSRSFNRTGTAAPEVCMKCFNRYCWDGTMASKSPDDYVPKLKLG